MEAVLELIKQKQADAEAETKTKGNERKKRAQEAHCTGATRIVRVGA